MSSQAQTPSFESLKGQFTDQKAIATSHMITLNAITDNFPNTETLATMLATEATLKDQHDQLAREIRLLENKSAAADVVFEDKAPAVTGQPRDKVITLQDYILAILVTTFAFFFVSTFFYVGKQTGWNKKTLGYMIAAAIVFTAVGYGVIRIYA